MKMRMTAAGVLCLASMAIPQALQACGDKYLVPSRGTRFQRAAPNRAPAAILVYANPASGLPKTLADLSIEAMLRKAGYKPTSIATADELDAALRQGGWDLVLVDAMDGQAVSRKLQGGNAPSVLPVVYKTSGIDASQAKKQYLFVLKSPVKSQSFLDGVDEALALRSKAAGKKS